MASSDAIKPDVAPFDGQVEETLRSLKSNELKRGGLAIGIGALAGLIGIGELFYPASAVHMMAASMFVISAMSIWCGLDDIRNSGADRLKADFECARR